jgi:glycosyltransferase involved in cell wall biosynthesis
MAIKELITVGIPVFNGQQFISKAVDSVLRQTFSGIRIVISDNASTDMTKEICVEKAKLDKRIRYIQHPKNLGLIDNFKFVLSQSTTKYFLWLAADDVIDERFFQFALEILEADDDVGLVFSSMKIINYQTKEITNIDVGHSASRKKVYRYLYRLQEDCPNLIYGLHRMEVLKKFTLEKFDYFDIHMAHWYELESKVRVIPIPLYTAGVNGTRIPFSLTGEELAILGYLRSEYKLLTRHFTFPKKIIIFAITALMIFKTNYNNNKNRKKLLRDKGTLC